MNSPPYSRSRSAPLLSAIRRGIVANDFVGASIVAAFSGGPDSTALLHALHTLRDDMGLKLYAAHLDHGLRAETAMGDAGFAREFAASLDIPVEIEKADTYALRDRLGLSIEDAARRLRYRFLSRVALERDADCIALGHTLDDQAETVLMRALRGAGVEGLSAMRELSSMRVGNNRVKLYRPMLSVRRSEVLGYCSENGLSPRLDESNLSSEFTRNRVRMDLIPKLEEYNPSARDALARLARSVSMDADFIRIEAERAAEDVIEVGSQGVAIEREGFGRLHPALGHHLLRLAVKMAKGDVRDLEFHHVSSMFDMMRGPAGKSVDLPGRIRFLVDYDRAYVRRADAPDSFMPSMSEDAVELKIPGNTIVGDWKVSSRYTANDGDFGYGERRGLRLIERFDADAMGNGAMARMRRAGDRFQPLGMASEKKLKDFMIDAHIPRRWRDSAPLIEAGGRIAWVVGWRIADWAKVSPGARRSLEMRFERAPSD